MLWRIWAIIITRYQERNNYLSSLLVKLIFVNKFNGFTPPFHLNISPVSLYHITKSRWLIGILSFSASSIIFFSISKYFFLDRGPGISLITQGILNFSVHICQELRDFLPVLCFSENDLPLYILCLLHSELTSLWVFKYRWIV